MTATKIRYQFVDGVEYKSDAGLTLPLNPVLSAPADLSDDQINQILGVIQAQRRETTSPCSSKLGNPRQLVFVRDNGNSMSIIVPDNTSIIVVAKSIADILENGGFKVVCVQLKGERFRNLVPILADVNKPDISPGSPIVPPSSSGKHKAIYRGVMKNYIANAPAGLKVLMPFLSQTDSIENKPYSGLTTEINLGTGDITTVLCGGNVTQEYRRYVAGVFTQVKGVQGIQTVTIPVASATDTVLFDLAKTVSNKNIVACLEYFGESNKALHTYFQLLG